MKAVITKGEISDVGIATLMSTPLSTSQPIVATSLVVDFFNGIVGGLVATFLTLVIQRMWVSVVLPWHEERIYKDAHFEGRWNAKETYNDSEPNVVAEYIIEFQRQGHKVTGTSTCVNGPDKGKVYLLSGSFNNLILTLTWVPKDKRSLERGTLAMKLMENGKKMSGHGVFYSPITETVHTSSLEAIFQV